jgi:hypothetical protein
MIEALEHEDVEIIVTKGRRPSELHSNSPRRRLFYPRWNKSANMLFLCLESSLCLSLT